MEFAHVSQNIKGIHMLDVVLIVFLIQIVTEIELVLEINVLILVLVLVELEHYVQYQIMLLFVPVLQAILEVHLFYVVHIKNLLYKSILANHLLVVQTVNVEILMGKLFVHVSHLILEHLLVVDLNVRLTQIAHKMKPVVIKNAEILAQELVALELNVQFIIIILFVPVLQDIQVIHLLDAHCTLSLLSKIHLQIHAFHHLADQMLNVGIQMVAHLALVYLNLLARRQIVDLNVLQILSVQ
jgi:hypothetical protein